MNDFDWMVRLQMLIAKFNYVDADIATITLIEAWGLYLHLSRLSES
jgi:hypothetical protein